MSLVDQLKKYYGSVKKLKNGGYLASNRNGDQLYVPANYNGNLSIVSYLPGTGGSKNDAAVLRSQFNSSNPPQYAISISSKYQDKNNTLERSYVALSTSGINVTNVATISFSASGGIGFNRMNTFLSKHPNVKGVMICNNAYGMNSYVNYKNTNALRQNGTPIIIIDPKGRDEAIKTSKSMQAAGLNGYWMQINYSDHPGINRDMLNNRMVEYALGLRSNFGQNRTNGNSCGYRLIKYDPKTKKYVTANYQDMVNGTALYAMPDVNAIMGYDGFTISTDARATTQNKVLSNLTNLSLTSKTGTVKAEFAYVDSAMNSIRNIIKSTNILSNTSNLTLRSGDGIPGCINSYINKYCDVVSEYLNSLAMQTESIESYAQALIDMDYDLANDANNVGKITETEFESETPQTSYDPNKEKEETPIVEDTPNDGKISGGGGGRSSSHSEDMTNKHKEIWFDYEDGHKGVIVYDNNNIAFVKYQYTYESYFQASSFMPVMNIMYANNDNIEKIEQEDNSINVYIKLEKYQGMNVDMIKETFFKEVTKDGQVVFR